MIFVFVKLSDSTNNKPKYSTITFSEITHPKTTQSETTKKRTRTKKKAVQKEENPPEVEKTVSKEVEISPDTSVAKTDSTAIIFRADSSDSDMKFAQSLLDTFLVRNPAYAKFILQEEAKGIAKRKFARQVLVKKINDELHKYLKSQFPEGSEHAINPHTGPGIQIPIGDLINLVKKIFN